MAMVQAKCSKCQEVGKIDIGEMSKDEVLERLKKWDSFHCFGNHVELTSPLDFWSIDWDIFEDTKAPTDEEFLTNLKKNYKEVYTKDELEKHYAIVGFTCGMSVCESKDSGEKKIFDFTHSPSGVRYYIL